VLVTFRGLHPTSIEAGLARNPGIVATAMHCVNAVPYVCAAPSGVLSYLDLPPVAGRAAPGLRRGR
jgi:2,4-diaminopentanoate dehydrogenase